MSPLRPLDSSGSSPGPDVCLATEFRPKVGEMVLSVTNGTKVHVKTNNAVLSPLRKSYFFAGFAETIESCRLHNIESGEKIQSGPCTTVKPTDPSPQKLDTEPGCTAADVDVCADTRPERTKVNFYLLLMNGVRLVFTKTLAFNTVLTIRAVMF